jgi:predicted RNA-binding Zn ribbon-like protein
MATERAMESAETPAWLLPDEPIPVRLMNTIWADRHGVHDSLLTRGHLAEWLRLAGATAEPVQVTDAEFAAGRDMRDALRRLAALLTEDSRPGAASALDDLAVAVRRVNSLARTARGPMLRLGGGLLTRDLSSQGRTGREALAAVAAEAVDFLTGADAPLLRACHAPGCVLYFVKDHPRREWCSTACGNRARAARHYARHRATGR